MSAPIDVTYDGQLRCTARLSTSGAVLRTDAPADNGGLGENFSPTEMVAAAVATCVLTTMAMVAARNKIDLTGLAATIDKTMVTAPVRRIGALHLVIRLPAALLTLSDADRQRLENAAHRCPVKQSLHPDIDAQIEFVYA